MKKNGYTSLLCPRCGAGRKIKIEGMGWVCSRCLEVCRRELESFKEIKSLRNRSLRNRLVCELSLELYHKVERMTRKEEARVVSSGLGSAWKYN